jgi:hypothetical protein
MLGRKWRGWRVRVGIVGECGGDPGFVGGLWHGPCVGFMLIWADRKGFRGYRPALAYARGSDCEWWYPMADVGC